MSRGDVLTRLKQFRRKVSKEFQLEDFEVRIIFVDINHYALAIENALLKQCSPLWNDQKVEFSFGNADSDTNNWNKYHLQKNSDMIKTMDDRVEEYIKRRRPSA